MSFKQILEGWRNSLLPPKALKEIITQAQEERLKECLNCRFNSSCGEVNLTSYCKSCGCNLKAKTACLSCQCPQGKWEMIIDDGNEKQLDEYLENETKED